MTEQEFDQYISESISKVLQDNMLQFIQIITAIDKMPSPKDIALCFTSMSFATKLSTLLTL
ncbi:MAG: hypothetical protein J6B85_13760 [Lachnospiraceae bacterium]|nr:hypothetical protein [Lachnospiraceae bacterium]